MRKFLNDSVVGDPGALELGLEPDRLGGEVDGVLVIAAGEATWARPSMAEASGCVVATAIHSSAADSRNPRRRYIVARSSRRCRPGSCTSPNTPSRVVKASVSVTRRSASSSRTAVGPAAVPSAAGSRPPRMAVAHAR